jgi:hypothetical protein
MTQKSTDDEDQGAVSAKKFYTTLERAPTAIVDSTRQELSAWVEAPSSEQQKRFEMVIVDGDT